MDKDTEKDLRPEVSIVREPPTKYVLAIETSASMSVNDKKVQEKILAELSPSLFFL